MWPVLKPICECGWNSAIVQILVIVANTKLRMFWAEVDKGSVRTVFGYGLGGPKPWVNILYKVGLFLNDPLGERESG